MSGEQNWTIETNAEDYLKTQKKKAEVADRRPVIRKPSDLVGPGIAAEAISLADFRNELALFNGSFSAAPGALDAPNSTDPFVGTVIGDPILGGLQSFTSLTTGDEYKRTFSRAPFDPLAIDWGIWRRTINPLPTTTTRFEGDFIDVPTDTLIPVPFPLLAGVREEEFYLLGSIEQGSPFSVLKSGIYTGSFQIRATQNFQLTLHLVLPNLGGSSSTTMGTEFPQRQGLVVPFTFIHTAEGSARLEISAYHIEASTQRVRIDDFRITRLCDAV